MKTCCRMSDKGANDRNQETHDFGDTRFVRFPIRLGRAEVYLFVYALKHEFRVTLTGEREYACGRDSKAMRRQS